MPQQGSGVTLQGQARAWPRGRVPSSRVQGTHAAGSQGTCPPSLQLLQGSSLRAAPSPGKARLSRAPEECAEGAVWTGSAGGCGPSGPARAAWCAASLTPDSGVGEPLGDAAWSWCRGAARAAWAPRSPGPPACRRPGAAWEGGGQSGAVAPGSFPWGADVRSAVWKGPPSGSRPSSDVGGCLCTKATVKQPREVHGPHSGTCVRLWSHSGHVLLVSFTCLGRGASEERGVAEARAAGSAGHSCSPRDLPPGALGPDMGAAPAHCRLWGLGARWTLRDMARPQGKPRVCRLASEKWPRPAQRGFPGAKEGASCLPPPGCSWSRQEGAHGLGAASSGRRAQDVLLRGRSACVSCDNCTGTLPS